MSSDKRLLLVLQRSLLACSVLFASALVGCGEDKPKEVAEEPATGDDDVGDDVEDEDDDGETPDEETAKPLDAGGRDGGPRPTAVDSGPRDSGGKADTGTTPKPDAGDVEETDAGDEEPPPPPGVTGGISETEDPTSASASGLGKFKVTTYTRGYPDAPEYADSTMHYPEGLDGPLPAIAIVPGFLSAQSSIQKWGPFLASHGIITFTIGTNSTSDQPPARGRALWGAIGTIKSENMREDSPIKGKVDLDRLALGGWSMGGQGVLLALNDHPELKAGLALCPWGIGARFPKVAASVIFLAAKNDQLAAGHSQPMYESLPETTNKMLWERSNADHFANDPDNNMGAQGRYGLSFMKVFLEGDTRYKQFLLEMPPVASDYKTNVK